MIQHQITGLGPTNPDGSKKIFTRLPNPFIVTAGWLEKQSKAPEVGDVLEVNEGGALKIVTETQAAEDETAAKPDADNAEKKSAGVSASGSGSELSPFKEYQGLPIMVHAAQIASVGQPDAEGNVPIIFGDESDKIASPGMMSRMSPHVGDYWVITNHSDGVYEYLNPKAVFESKYKLKA